MIIFITLYLNLEYIKFMEDTKVLQNIECINQRLLLKNYILNSNSKLRFFIKSHNASRIIFDVLKNTEYKMDERNFLSYHQDFS